MIANKSFYGLFASMTSKACTQHPHFHESYHHLNSHISLAFASCCMLNVLSCRQVDHDSDFLEQERIMDYSLLVGIHFREVSQSGEPLTSGSRTSGVHTPSGIYFIPLSTTP